MAKQCADIRPWLSAYIDGELDAGRQEEVRAHQETCPACRHELAALQRTAHAMQAWCVPEVDPRLSAVFAERLSARQARRPRWYAQPSGLRPRLAWAVAVVVLALGALGIGHLPGLLQPTTREAHIAHHDAIASFKAMAQRVDTAAVPVREPHMPQQGRIAQRRIASAGVPFTRRARRQGIHAVAPRIVASLAPHKRQRPAATIPDTPAATPDVSGLAVALITETPVMDSGTPKYATVNAGATAGHNGNTDVTDHESPALVQAAADEGPERMLLGYISETD